MSAVGITENVKGDVKKFEIWYSGREEVYVIQVNRPPRPQHHQVTAVFTIQHRPFKWYTS